MKRRIVILAEKRLGPLTSKMANGVIRYLNKEVVAVIDSRHAGKTVQDVLKFGGDIPIYSSLEEAISHNPNTLLIGISQKGGKFPSEWYSLVITAIQNRLHIVSGLHDYLTDIAEFKVLAEKYHVRLTDLRKVKKSGIVARGIAKKFKSKIILTVGTHGNVGKMTATIEMVKQMQKSGKAADWIATGQIGMLIKGKGIAVDTVKGDFISGAVESAVANADGSFEYIFVEGQGSIQHLGYSSVALALMHGCLPDAMILCHRSDVGISDYGVDTENLTDIIQLYESMLSFIKPSKVIAIAVNTYHMSDEKASAYLEDVTQKTGLPATDPIRFGAEDISNQIVSYFKSYKKPKLK
jgi:uncharacterized NAD-dependent epimerase/dehydratase family protein